LGGGGKNPAVVSSRFCEGKQEQIPFIEGGTMGGVKRGGGRCKGGKGAANLQPIGYLARGEVGGRKRGSCGFKRGEVAREGISLKKVNLALSRRT